MTVFVRLPPGASAAAASAVRAAGAVPVDGAPPAPFVPIGAPDELEALPDGASAWLVGVEAGGETTALVLIRAAARAGRPWVAEGLGPRAAAATLAVGAAGIVLDGLTDPGAIEAAVTDLRARAERARRAGVLLADPVGAGGPIVQGPMANVAEGTGLARAVRRAGAMPFAALGALDPRQAEALLARWADEVPGPWGAGVIGFDVMPFRDAHLDAIARLGARGPAAVTLAGGSPALALACARRGLAAWLHTPSGRLADQALAQGVRAVILEGHEAGGHVGRTPSTRLWEDGLAAAEAHAAARPLVVLAGGIGDAISAAFAAAMAADAHAAGARVLLQAGTAFLLTHEALEHGHVTPVYQAKALAARSTVLVGASVNLPLRCVPNAFTEQARALEAAWEQDGVPRPERRHRLERHNLGRTRIAAKGIERNPAWGEDPSAAKYRPVPPERQEAEGAFTVGQGAVVTDRLAPVAELVEVMTHGARERLGLARPRSRWGPVRTVGGRPAERGPVAIATGGSAAREGDVAIVGVGCVLPGALDVATFWRNLVEGVDAVVPVPDERWPSHRYFDPAAGATGPVKSYARHAGLVRGFTFDPLRYRIPPKVAPTLDPSQRLALAAAEEAVQSAGWHRPGFDRRRAAVVLGNAMGGEYAKSMALRVRFREVIDAVARDPLAEGWSLEELRALEARVEDALARRLPPVEVDSMAGLLSNVVAGRICAWLDWMGGNLTVDAACAASLAAVAVAVDWLRVGRCDAVLAGGVDTDLSPESYVGFCRTEALSRTGSSPFSTRADGFVMGEGAAVLALKRLADAERDGDPIWAVIRGVGVSSDGRGRGITAPRPEGQALAVERAYAESGLEPAALGLVEAHGTGTAVGDATELGVLARAFAGAPPPVWLGSVKSNIGHLKGAAGAAGLLKAALALRAGIVPPTLHAAPVAPELGLERTPFRLPSAPVALPDERARASVSAFGFGGTDYHVLLERPARGRAPAALPALARVAEGLALPAEAASWGAVATPLLLPYGAESPAALRAAVEADRPLEPEACARAPWRAVVLVPDPAGRAAAVARAARWLATGPAPGSALGSEVFTGEGAPRPVVLGFPGQGAQRLGGVDALARVPAGARALHALDRRIRALLGDERPLRERERAGDRAAADPLALHAVLFALGVGWTEVLRAAKVPVAATVGHSLGAFAALVAAGAWSAEDALPVVLARGRALAACPAGAMLAVRLPEVEALEVAHRHGLALAAVNGPDRCVLAGDAAAIDAAAAALGPARARRVEVERAYHSPAVAPAADAVREALAGARLSPPSIPVWSARTGAPVDDPAVDLVAGVVEPVRFHAALAALARAGHHHVVEAGPGTTVARMADAAGAVGIPLDPGDLGPAVAAARLLALGHDGLVRILPGTLVELALPAPAPAPPREVAAGPRPADPGLAARARAVTDLRIAALADPALAPAWEAARDALARDLAAADARLAGAALPARPEPAPAPVAAPPPAPEPAPAPAPAPADNLRAAVLAAICEVTGYPPEFVADGADLEGDLGIDSIRKMEILGLLEKRLGFTTAESDYALLAEADLAALVAHVRRRLEGPSAPVAAAAPVAVGFAVEARVPVAAELPPGALRIRPGRAPAEVVRELLAALRTPGEGELRAIVPADAGGEAAAAFLRCAARETGRPLRLVQLDADGPRASVAVELAPREGAALPERPVVLATGGSTGIVAACLRALADLRPRIVLLSRTDPATVAERLRDLGEVVAVQGDVAHPGVAAAAADEARRRFGRIDVVLHGAGVLRDRPLARLTDDDLAAVLAPKWDGARALLAATAEDPLAAWVTFSSIVARVGNPGQAPYAAANAALATLRHPRAARSLAIGWTAWSGVGMAADERLQAVLAGRGLVALPPEAGAAAFRRLLCSPVDGVVWVTGQPLDEVLRPAWPLGPPTAWSRDRIVFPVPLDPAAPVLSDHRVGGRPLVPAAVWLAAFVEAARVASGSAGPWSVEAMDIVAPTFVDRPRDDVAIELVAAAGAWTATVRAGAAVVCTARLAACAAPADRGPPTPLAGAEPAAPLYRPDLLFHGPAWRVLERMRAGDDGHVAADLRASDGPSAVASAVDGVHQLLAAWSGRSVGWLGLPVGADRWVAAGPAVGPLRIETRADARGREVRADVVALDGSGRVVLRGEGVRLRAASPLGPGGPADA